MARKVFISVLGSTNYYLCKYKLGDFLSHDTYFVQTATIELHKIKDTWNENDRCCILLTKGDRGSLKNNWENCPGKNYEHGLKDQLEAMGLPCPVIPYIIKNEFDIWEIFNMLCKLVEEDYEPYEGYELYIDITHSFRYIPMLLVVFANFSKFMRQTTVKAITYGNWEARDPNTNTAPFIDMTPLAALQAWTAAADQFLTAGSVEKMSDLLKPITAFDTNSSTNTIKKTASVATFMANLRKMIGERQMCQGYNIIMSESIKKVKGNIRQVRSNVQNLNAEGIKPFERIIDKIETSVEDFNKEPDTTNVFKAVEWCYKHGMHQQALTLLREGILTYLMDAHPEYECGIWSKGFTERESFKEIIMDEAWRQNSWRPYLEKEDKRCWTFTNFFEKRNYEYNKEDDELAEVFVQLTDIRNQYNHGGMIEGGKSQEEIVEAIKGALERVKTNLNI